MEIFVKHKPDIGDYPRDLNMYTTKTETRELIINTSFMPISFNKQHNNNEFYLKFYTEEPPLGTDPLTDDHVCFSDDFFLPN